MTEGEDTSATLVLIRSGDLSRPTAVDVIIASGSADGNNHQCKRFNVANRSY